MSVIPEHITDIEEARGWLLRHGYSAEMAAEELANWGSSPAEEDSTEEVVEEEWEDDEEEEWDEEEDEEWEEDEDEDEEDLDDEE
tara:strand:- start:160 stop:414 length:255 start_codon:yes stop_codon:yes gene_type:complete